MPQIQETIKLNETMSLTITKESERTVLEAAAEASIINDIMKILEKQTTPFTKRVYTKKDPSIPSKCGMKKGTIIKHWKKSEIRLLKKMRKEGCSNKVIADKIGRDYKSICSKIYWLNKK